MRISISLFPVFFQPNAASLLLRTWSRIGPLLAVRVGVDSSCGCSGIDSAC